MITGCKCCTVQLHCYLDMWHFHTFLPHCPRKLMQSSSLPPFLLAQGCKWESGLKDSNIHLRKHRATCRYGRWRGGNHPLPLEESLDLPGKIILGDWKKKEHFSAFWVTTKRSLATEDNTFFPSLPLHVIFL